MTDNRCDAELQLARIREVLRDRDLYDSYNSVTTRCLVRDIKQAMDLPQTGTDVPDPDPIHTGAIDANHLDRQRDFSERTFGPGSRMHGVTDHIRKELDEVLEAAPNNLHEWVDVIILAFDGAWRSGATSQEIIDAVIAKQTRNESRAWPDWQNADPDKAIEHVRA